MLLPTPYRQFVLVMPFDLHHRVSRDPVLASRTLSVFGEELTAHLRAATDTDDFAQPGMVTFIQRFGRAKKTAPTHPHPRAPDEPPALNMAGPMAAAMDRGRDTLKNLARRAKMKRDRPKTPRHAH